MTKDRLASFFQPWKNDGAGLLVYKYTIYMYIYVLPGYYNHKIYDSIAFILHYDVMFGHIWGVSHLF